MNVLQKRKQAMPSGDTQAVALGVTGVREPIEPAYSKTLTPSPIASQCAIPSEPTEWKAPVVMRGDRVVGMRYLYARGAVAQPISPLGTGPDIGIAVWSSDANPDFMGPIHDAGFNDALFQAGYPGFNLGLSFKVPSFQAREQKTGGPGGGNMRMRSSNVRTFIQKVTNSKSTSNKVG
jgi:hypothetical protein